MTETFLPAVHGAGVQGQSDNALTFIDAWMQALGDRATEMRQDDRLVRCAQDHAAYLESRVGDIRQVSMHVGLNNSTPDQRVRLAGYSIPAHWHSNHVESCATHTGGPLAALTMLLDSPGHRAHLIGENGFAGHRVYGVGNAKSYYVVLACPEEVDVG